MAHQREAGHAHPFQSCNFATSLSNAPAPLWPLAAPARARTCRRPEAVGACPSTAAPPVTAATSEPPKAAQRQISRPQRPEGQPQGAEWGRWRWCGQSTESLGPMHRLARRNTQLALSSGHHKPHRAARQQLEGAAVHMYCGGALAVGRPHQAPGASIYGPLLSLQHSHLILVVRRRQERRPGCCGSCTPGKAPAFCSLHTCTRRLEPPRPH